MSLRAWNLIVIAEGIVEAYFLTTFTNVLLNIFGFTNFLKYPTVIRSQRVEKGETVMAIIRFTILVKK